MPRRATIFTAVLATVGPAILGLAQEERTPPKKPERPFAVFVYTEGLTNDEVDMPEVASEVAKRIDKKKRWLDVVASRDEADVVVEVMTHAVNEQHRTKIDSRVDFRGVGKNYYDTNFVTEWHRIEARITFPDGSQRMLTGRDERERGGSVKGAASDLAKRLEETCKENYWDLVGS